MKRGRVLCALVGDEDCAKEKEEMKIGKVNNISN